MRRRWMIMFALAACGAAGVFGLSLAQDIDLLPVPHRLYQALATGDTARSASAYRALGDPASALSRALAITNPSEADLRQTAELALDIRRWESARLALGALVERQPSDGWAHGQLGVLLAADDRQAALGHLREALALGDPTAADLIAVLEANTDRRTLAYEVGSALAALEQYPAAEYAFAQAAIFSPSPAEAVASVGLVRALQGLDYLPWLEHAQALAPSSAEVHTLSGLAHRAAGRAFESLESLLVALERSPLDPEINAQVAEAYLLLGDEQSSLFWLSQAALLGGETSRYTEAYRAAAAALTRPPLDPAP